MRANKIAPLGQVLLDAGLVTSRQLEEALSAQRRSGTFLGETLISLGAVKAKDLGPLLAESLGLSYVNPRECEITQEIVDLVQESFIRERRVLPLREEDGRLVVAMVDPLDLSVLDDLKLITGMPVVPVLSLERELMPARKSVV